MDGPLRDPDTYALIGAAMEVHGQLGCGFLEAVYQEALAIEFTHRRIAFEAQVQLPVSYRNIRLGCGYRADFVCFGRVIVEIKALHALSGQEEAQLINYLKAARVQTGLLLNFGAARLVWRRFVY